MFEQDFTQEEQTDFVLPVRDLLEAPAARLSPALQTLRLARGNSLIELADNEPSALVVDRTLLPVPVAVVTAAETVMRSQGDFLATWLSPFLHGQRGVVLTENDKGIYQEQGVDPIESLALLEMYRDSLVRLTPTLPEETSLFMERLRAVVATNQITQAVANRETKNLWYLFALGTSITGVVESLQQLAPKLPGLLFAIYAVAGTADNALTIKGEINKLQNQGKELREALRAMAFPTLMLLASWGLAPIIDHQFRVGNNLQAGSLYGLESTTCVWTTFAGGSSQAKDYLALVREGKVADPRLNALLQREETSLWERLQILGLSVAAALRHDLIYPHHAGFYVGGLLVMLASVVTANVTLADGQPLMLKSPVLGPLGIGDSIGGTLFSLGGRRFYDLLLRRDLRRLRQESLTGAKRGD